MFYHIPAETVLFWAVVSRKVLGLGELWEIDVWIALLP